MDLAQFWDYTAWHHEANCRAYDAPADPRALLEVPPADITHRNGELGLHWGLGRVQGEDWDQHHSDQPFRESTFYRSLEYRFTEGVDWAETEWYHQRKARFEQGETVRGYETLAEFRQVRCAYIDELFRKIEREGYRPNAAAAHERASETNPFEDAYANYLEPLVVIGRDGDIYLTEGYHRFAIASILELDALPVQVLCRHENWQERRDQLKNAAPGEHTDLRERYGDHPDLQELI